MRLRVPHPSPAYFICKLFPLSNHTSTIILYPATQGPQSQSPYTTQLSKDLSATKSYFECSIWIVSVMHTAFNNRKKTHSNFDGDTGLLSTAWT